MSDEIQGPAQPTHAEILANLAAMRPQRAEAPRGTETFDELARRMFASQASLPVQHCPVCGSAFRHHHPGRCHPCAVARRRG